jgi:hypothetical protein
MLYSAQRFTGALCAALVAACTNVLAQSCVVSGTNAQFDVVVTAGANSQRRSARKRLANSTMSFTFTTIVLNDSPSLMFLLFLVFRSARARHRVLSAPGIVPRSVAPTYSLIADQVLLFWCIDITRP